MNFRMVGWILCGLSVLAVGIIANDWRLDAKKLPLVEKELSDERAAFDQYKADAKIVADASAGYQAELAILRERNSTRPNFPVRLCRAAPAPDVRVPPTERGPDGGTPGTGVVSDNAGMHPGPDIGPQLRALSDRADRVTAQGRGLQNAADGLAPQ